MSLTDMVLMPGADYKAVCENVRAVLGETETIKSGQLPGKVLETYNAGFANCEEKWAGRYYSTYVRGNGERNISMELPFTPDLVMFGYNDPYAFDCQYAFVSFYRDFRTFGQRACFIFDMEKGAMYPTAISNNTADNYIKFENGVLTFIAASKYNENTVWQTNSLYHLIAIKCVEDGKTDEELLKEYVMRLPDTGGTVTISKRRFGETGLTEDAFNAFTAANKPNWTFVIA